MVKLRPQSLKNTRWYEYLIRFVLGGLATVSTGLIARYFGPVTGGLFLAFPAIFCASATLIEKHERERKARKGMTGTRRGKYAAALDAEGAALGSIALAAFGAIVWLAADQRALVLPLALSAWAAAAFLLWTLRRRV